MSYDNNAVDYEIINSGEQTHESKIVHNVIYGPTSRKEAKRLQNRDEELYTWAKSLGGNRYIVSETHNFAYQQYSVNDKGKKTNDYYVGETKQPDTSENKKMKVSASTPTVEERLRKVRENAGLT